MCKYVIKSMMKNCISVQICSFWRLLLRGWKFLTFLSSTDPKGAPKKVQKCGLTNTNAIIKFQIHHYVSMEIFSFQVSFYLEWPILTPLLIHFWPMRARKWRLRGKSINLLVIWKTNLSKIIQKIQVLDLSIGSVTNVRKRKTATSE